MHNEEKPKKSVWTAVKEFLNDELTMPVWVAWTMSFFAGSGLAYWALYLIGKPFGVEYVWMPKTWISE